MRISCRTGFRRYGELPQEIAGLLAKHLRLEPPAQTVNTGQPVGRPCTHRRVSAISVLAAAAPSDGPRPSGSRGVTWRCH